MKKYLASSFIALTLLSTSTIANSHNLHLGIGTLGKDTKADNEVTLGYSYITGEDLKYGAGISLGFANGDNEEGDSFIVDARVGKEFTTNTTIFAKAGLAGMGTGIKNKGKDAEAAGGTVVGISLQHKLNEKFDLEIAYNSFDLEYTINNKDYDYKVSSGNFGIIYKF